MPVRAAEVVLPAPELDAAASFFAERLGFRVLLVQPADDPRAIALVGHGLRLRLERDAGGDPGVLRLLCARPAELAAELGAELVDGAAELTAPNGTRVLLVEAEPPVAVPPLRPAFVLTRAGEAGGGAAWIRGRAGMLYRDLVPDRQGGRFIASHIRIPAGGPVPDWVHFHRVRFQLIFCRRGWVRLVYEDQGEPFVLRAGDCVLQPPRIRHRVLECSDGLEVIEVGSPAEHETLADHELELPTGRLAPERDFDGQRFVRHEASGATWEPWRLAGFEARDTGIAAGTGGLATVRVVRPRAAPGGEADAAAAESCTHDAELVLLFVLAGQLALEVEGHGAPCLGPDDAVVLPPGVAHRIAAGSPDLELLEIAAPAGFATLPGS